MSPNAVVHSEQVALNVMSAHRIRADGGVSTHMLNSGLGFAVHWTYNPAHQTVP
jgi:hypothetical protein